MNQVLTTEIKDKVGLVIIDSPPVNALGFVVRAGIAQGITTFAADPQVDAIVILCGGRTFFAGADITEFGKPPREPNLLQVLGAIESCSKPVVAAIHGTALGGGLELALTCHYRIAVPSAKVGLPEVNLGLLPGAGGTQRLPRIVGPELALEFMVEGKPIAAPRAAELGVIDRLAGEGCLRRDAIAFARELADKPLVRVRDREDKVAPARGHPELFEKFRKDNARLMLGFKAPAAIVKAVEAAVELPFEAGMARERELFTELVTSNESRAQRHVFFAERQTAKIPDIAPDTQVRPIVSVGVIGAGTMGGGIAMNFLDAGLPVTIVETSQAAIDRGLGVIRRNYERSAARGKLSAEAVEHRMGLLKPALALEALGEVDLVIEAVFEDMAVKKDIFGKLDAIARPGAMLATNTSYLDVNEIAGMTKRPGDVLGLHFFSPANVMRLLEIVRGAQTAPEVIATAMKLARTISKVPVLSGVCHGFIANRMMTHRSREANELVLEGPSPQEIDRALVDYGFAMGPFQMLDLVGLDVIRRPGERTPAGELVERGRLGQKSGGGFYDYDENRRATPSSEAEVVIAELARARGIARNSKASPDEIVARLLYPVVNEAARILDEGIALRASDIDMAAILGYNWPVYAGGPMFWAETVGLDRIVAKLRELEQRHGERFRPADLLVRLAVNGGSFADQ